MKTLILCCVIAGALVGCGGGGGSTETAGSTTDPSTTQNPSGTTDGGASTSTTNSPTTGAPETTSGPGTDTTNSPSTATTGASTDTGTGETTAGESTAGETTAGETTGDPDTTTGVEPGSMCKTDADCTLLSDCCVCKAIAVGEPPPPCDVPECFIPQCDALMIDSVSCRFGTCVTEKLNCDASQVLCDAEPPVCPPGQLPGVTANGDCWTNGCVPIDLCNVVPDCDLCPKSQMCVTYETVFGPSHRCEPIPPECMGQPNCGCAGVACEPPFDTCAEQPDGLYCSCPNC